MKNSRIQGWIFDLYPKDGGMVVWLKSRDGTITRINDEWNPAFYASGKRSDLDELARQLNIKGLSFEEKQLSIEDCAKSQFLRIPVSTTNEAFELAKRITLSSRKFRFFNVDISADQLYLYEKDLFPMAHVEVELNYNSVRWQILDNSREVDYETPKLTCIDLDLSIDSEGTIPSFKDPLKEISIRSQEELIMLNSDEEENLLGLVELFNEIDPDVIYTHKGTSILFPYLAFRAHNLGIYSQIILGRERVPLKISSKKGKAYLSYGRVQYRYQPIRLGGRIHIDKGHTFLNAESGLEGIIEVARTCRIPLQRCADTTIGTSMTSIQLYTAFKQGILAPWFKSLPEELKTAEELIIADRGGLYYSPIAGVYTDVGELDFSSLYPTLMCKFNLSGETITCKCCPQSRHRVPELGYNICEKRRGITPTSLENLLEKRLRYKQMMKEASSPLLKEVYRKRQAALKWILVCA